MVLVTHDRFSLVLGSRKLPKNCNLAVSDICCMFNFLYPSLYISFHFHMLAEVDKLNKPYSGFISLIFCLLDKIWMIFAQFQGRLET